MTIDDIPDILEHEFPQYTNILRDSADDEGRALYYPMLSQVLGETVDKAKRSAFRDREELSKMLSIAEKVFAEGDERVQTLFVLEFVDSFGHGLYPDIPIDDIAGPLFKERLARSHAVAGKPRF